MFNIFEGSKDEKARKLQERLEILKRAREDGFFDEERIEPMPEIVADGKGPDDRHPPVFEQASPEHGERCPNPGGNVAGPAPTHKYYTSQPCSLCLTHTRHISYGQGSPTWHCTVCCICDFCMEEAERKLGRGTLATHEQIAGMREAREQIEQGREALHDAIRTPREQLFFCTKCGAGLRCGVCNNTATGRYCDLCGRKDTGEGFCTDCWKEADLDG